MYIQTVSDLERNLTELRNSPVLGLDTETTGFCPFKDELKVIQLSNGSKTLVISVPKIGKKALNHYLKPILEDKGIVKVLHNAKFDLKFIKQQLKIDVERIFDTMLASIMIEAGISKEKGFHGLEQTVKRYLKINIDKGEQKSDWSGELTTSQIEYAERDAQVLLPLREEMLGYLKKYGLIRCAKLEFEAVLPVAWIELCGFYLDFDEWMNLANENKRKADELAASINADLLHLLPQGTLFGETGINLGSVQQVQKYFRELGVPMPDSTKEHFLNPLKEDYPIVGKLLDFRGYDKSYTSFGENYREFVNPITGRIHANFFQIGAPTGRFACSSPNLSQIPHTKEHRGCFKPEEGNVLISADFSQEELRLLADFSGDKGFLTVFEKGGDFHRATAAQVFNIPVEEVSPEQRTFAKRLNFGVVYGIGAKRFALNAGILETEASMIINQYFKTFRKVKRWLEFQKQQVLVKGYARTPSGRMTRYEFDPSDRQAASAVQREAANLPMQGGGADILKRSLRVFYDNSKPYHDKIKLVNIVHDQKDVEAPRDIADEVEDVMVKSMIQAGSEFVNHVQIKVDSHQSECWAKD